MGSFLRTGTVDRDIPRVSSGEHGELQITMRQPSKHYDVRHSIGVAIEVVTDEAGNQTFELWGKHTTLDVYMPVMFLNGRWAHLLRPPFIQSST